MKHATCPICNHKMVRNGTTSKGSQRWRCKACGGSTTHKINTDSRDLETFLDWLLSNKTQMSMSGGGRTFRRKTSRFWDIWPMPEFVDEIHQVIYVDGIWIARNIIVLIACSDSFVLSWYLARSENAESWAALLSRIAPPAMVVCDGGSGFKKASERVWPNTKIQRCLFHVHCQVRR